MEQNPAPKKRYCRRPARALIAGLALIACAWGGSSEPGEGAYREMLETQRERAAATPSEETRRPSTVVEKLREGDSFRESDETGRAMWNYLQAHNLDRDDPRPLEKIASLHLKKDPDRAESLFVELAEKHPESAPAHTGLGLARLAKGDLPDAGASLRRATELDPNSVVALSALGVVYDRLDMHERAQKYYHQALAIHPRDYESLNNLGVSCMLTGDYAEATAAFRQAAKLEPRDPAVQNNLGMALAEMEQYDEALEAFRKGGDEQGALNNLAYVYYLNGDFEEAIAHYEQALLAEGDAKLTVLRNLRLAQEALALEGGAETTPSAWKADEVDRTTVWVPETPPEAEPQDDAQKAAMPGSENESTPATEPPPASQSPTGNLPSN